MKLCIDDKNVKDYKDDNNVDNDNDDNDDDCNDVNEHLVTLRSLVCPQGQGQDKLLWKRFRNST